MSPNLKPEFPRPPTRRKREREAKTEAGFPPSRTTRTLDSLTLRASRLTQSRLPQRILRGHSLLRDPARQPTRQLAKPIHNPFFPTEHPSLPPSNGLPWPRESQPSDSTKRMNRSTSRPSTGAVPNLLATLPKAVQHAKPPIPHHPENAEPTRCWSRPHRVFQRRPPTAATAPKSSTCLMPKAWGFLTSLRPQGR